MEHYSIIISSKAQSDITECVGFVLRVSKEAARNLADEIYQSIELLVTFPERFPIFEMPNTFPLAIRKLIVKGRYVVLYSIEGNNVVVYRILDSRRGLDYLVL